MTVASWRHARLADVTSVGSGSGFPKKFQGKKVGAYPFYKVSDMNLAGNERLMRVHQNAISVAVSSELKAAVHPVGTIIFPKIGAAIATNKKRILTTPACFDNNVIGIHPADCLHTSFLFHLLRTKNLSEFANRGNPPSIRKTTVEGWEIPLPPLAEQKRIAGILDAADALRAKRRESLAQLDTLLQSTFLDMFGDPVTAGWEMAKVEDVALPEKGSIRTGPFGSQLLHSEFVAKGVRVLGIDNAVKNEFLEGQPRYVTEQKYEELRRYTVRPGDVLITIMGTCGRCAVVPEGVGVAINTKHLCCITLDPRKCLPAFMHAYFLQHPLARTYLEANAKGAIMAGLNMGLIKRMPIPLAPRNVQQRFSKVAGEIAAQKSLQQAHLAELDALFASLQSRAFRGEL